MKRFIRFGERIKAENESMRKKVLSEGVVYQYGPLPRWIRWLDKKLPTTNDDWRNT